MDWKMFLLGAEEWVFLMETAIRTVIMFLVILMSLRLLGKRGVKQLSVFELGVIIGLGSAAGDPMFYKDVGLLMGILVFLIVVSMYRFITYLINRNDRFEQFMEGQPACILKNGRLLMSDFEKEPIARDELFAQLRLHSVSHLGQVQQAILETNGEVSIFYFPDEDVKHGLPIIPDWCEKQEAIRVEDIYACTYCGHTQTLPPAPLHQCSKCGKTEWAKAINSRRIT